MTPATKLQSSGTLRGALGSSRRLTRGGAPRRENSVVTG